MYHNDNIRLLSRYDVENTQVKLVIHVLFAWLTKLATLQKSYGQWHYFQILSTFSYDFSVGHWPADTMQWWAKAIDFL